MTETLKYKLELENELSKGLLESHKKMEALDNEIMGFGNDSHKIFDRLGQDISEALGTGAKTTIHHFEQMMKDLTQESKRMADSVIESLDKINDKKNKPTKDPKPHKQDNILGDVAEAQINKFGNISGFLQDNGLGSMLEKIPKSALLAAGGVAAVGAGVGFLAHTAYEAGNHFADAERDVSAFMRSLHGEELDNATAKIEAMTGVFEKDRREILGAGVSLQQSFGGETLGNIDKIKQALLLTNGAIDLDYIKEYSTQFKAAGLNAEELLAISVKAQQSNIYQDKALDAIKEATLRLHELPKAVTDTFAEMESVGAKFNVEGKIFSAKQLQKELKLGKVSTFEAMQSIAHEMDTMNLGTKQSVIANIFGAPGEDAGAAFFDMLRDGIPTMQTLENEAGGWLQTQKMQLDYHERINKEIAKFAPQMSVASTAIENIKLEAELFFFQTVAKGMDWWELHQAGINTALKVTGSVIERLEPIFYNTFILPTELVLDAIDLIGSKWDLIVQKGKAAAGLFMGLSTGNVGQILSSASGLAGFGNETKDSSTMHDMFKQFLPDATSPNARIASILYGDNSTNNSGTAKKNESAFKPSGMKLPPSTDKEGKGGEKVSATGGVGGAKNITIIVTNKINADIRKDQGESPDEFAQRLAAALAREQRNVENM